jgi:hypothetical protein
VTRYNAWGEPIPVRLSGPLGLAWSHLYMTNEGFDGEDGIAHSVQQRLIRDWNANGPATVSVFDYRTRQTSTRDFPTLREAYRYAIACGEGATVRMGVSGCERAPADGTVRHARMPVRVEARRRTARRFL